MKTKAIKTVHVRTTDLAQPKRDIAQIKKALLGEDDEGELTSWAKQELQKARAEPEENYISLEELEGEILGQ